jgi:hypothetical protein
VAADVGVAGGALMGFSQNAGRTILLAHDTTRFADWCSNTSDENSRKRALELFGCEPYQVGALALQQLGFGPEIALAAALAGGHLHHELIEDAPVVSTWKAAFNWIEALCRGASCPADAESRTAFNHLLPPEVSGEVTNSIALFHTELAQLVRERSCWMWHLPKGSYEETAAHLASPPQATVKGKVWKTNKREIIFEGRNS